MRVQFFLMAVGECGVSLGMAFLGCAALSLIAHVFRPSLSDIWLGTMFFTSVARGFAYASLAIGLIGILFRYVEYRLYRLPQ